MDKIRSLKTTEWTCQNCGKRAKLMMVTPEQWDTERLVICIRCKAKRMINHRERIIL